MGRSGSSGGRAVRRMALAWCAALLMMLTGCALPFASASPGTAGPAAPAVVAQWPVGTPQPARNLALDLVNARIAHMTLDQELGQLFVITVTYPNMTPDLQKIIGPMDVGGVIIYASGMYTLQQTRQFTSEMQHDAAIPLIIGADEEGGGDEQLGSIFPPHPTEADVGTTGDPKAALQLGTQMGQQLKQLGLNTDFAPIVDVVQTGWFWLRAFGRSPQLVTQMGAAEVDGLQGQGIMASLKHFPGLGSMNCNPHFCLPVINSSRDYIEQNDLVPFRDIMAHNNPAMIMTTDLLMPALDPKMPAELSKPIVTGILRQEMGYDGVVITDALYMEGITAQFSEEQAGVLAIEAGNDLIEGPSSSGEMQAMVDALHQAVQSGQLSKARIDESVRRILLLKMRYGLLPSVPTSGQRDVAQSAQVPGGGMASTLSGSALAPERREETA